MKFPAISTEAEKKAIFLMDNYKRLGIYFTLRNSPDNKLYVQVEQKKYINDKVLTDSELTDRVKEVFKNKLADGVELIINPIFSNADEIRSVNADYVNKKLEVYHLKPSHLVKYLDLDKSTISELLGGTKDFTKPLRAAFYYFFKNINFKQAQEPEKKSSIKENDDADSEIKDIISRLSEAAKQSGNLKFLVSNPIIAYSEKGGSFIESASKVRALYAKILDTRYKISKPVTGDEFQNNLSPIAKSHYLLSDRANLISAASTPNLKSGIYKGYGVYLCVCDDLKYPDRKDEISDLTNDFGTIKLGYIEAVHIGSTDKSDLKLIGDGKPGKFGKGVVKKPIFEKKPKR